MQHKDLSKKVWELIHKLFLSKIILTTMKLLLNLPNCFLSRLVFFFSFFNFIQRPKLGLNDLAAVIERAWGMRWGLLLNHSYSLQAANTATPLFSHTFSQTEYESCLFSIFQYWIVAKLNLLLQFIRLPSHLHQCSLIGSSTEVTSPFPTNLLVTLKNENVTSLACKKPAMSLYIIQHLNFGFL